MTPESFWFLCVVSAALIKGRRVLYLILLRGLALFWSGHPLRLVGRKYWGWWPILHLSDQAREVWILRGGGTHYTVGSEDNWRIYESTVLGFRWGSYRWEDHSTLDPPRQWQWSLSHVIRVHANFSRLSKGTVMRVILAWVEKVWRAHYPMRK